MLFTGNSQELSGAAEIDNGEIESMDGYKFDVEDKILPPNNWKITVRTPVETNRQPGEPAAGIVLTLLAGPASEVRVSTSRGAFASKPSAIAAGLLLSFARRGPPGRALSGMDRLSQRPRRKSCSITGWASIFTGDNFEAAAGALPITIYVRGTKPVAALRIIRDQKIIHSVEWSRKRPDRVAIADLG